jgi:hypothetical protein
MTTASSTCTIDPFPWYINEVRIKENSGTAGPRKKRLSEIFKERGEVVPENKVLILAKHAYFSLRLLSSRSSKCC